MSVKFVTARFSTTTDEQASKVQYMFLVQENFLTTLRNWTVAPTEKEKRTNELMDPKRYSGTRLIQTPKGYVLSGFPHYADTDACFIDTKTKPYI